MLLYRTVQGLDVKAYSILFSILFFFLKQSQVYLTPNVSSRNSFSIIKNEDRRKQTLVSARSGKGAFAWEPHLYEVETLRLYYKQYYPQFIAEECKGDEFK